MIFRDTYGLPLPSKGGWGAHYLCFIILMSFLCLSGTDAAVPRFFESNRMTLVKIPRDSEVDTIIYRLRAQDTDRDYPLLFNIKGPIGLNLIYIDAHECTASTDIFCEADVYLRQAVEVGRIYIFNLTVTDQRGYETEVIARVDATNGRATPLSEIFVRYSPTVEIKEDKPIKSMISSMVVRKRRTSNFGEIQVLGPARKRFRMAPGNLVSAELINGTLILERKVDFEEANLHTFKVCLLQPFVEEKVDTRNIACVIMSVVVEDVQDEPPMFVVAPPVTRVPSTAVQGDAVAQVEAKDGDRGIPRALRYSILPASSLYTQYFRMNPKTGVITMNETALKLREKMISLDPILMTVTAEEITNSLQSYPALSSSVEIAFVVLDAEFLEPKFIHENYVGEVYEDSVPDTQVFFNSPFLTQGVKGLFALELDGDKGAFSVQPGVVTDSGDIRIKVKNSFLLDYERTQQMNFKLVARQITGRHQSSTSTEITIRIIDVNDNVPEFSQQQYEVEIYENFTRGTSIARVYATDKDSGEFGIVRYTNIIGTHAEKLYLDPTSGLITCATDNHDFDREEAAEYIITVEAKDNNGHGPSANTVTAKVIIRLKDVNDSPPRFVDSIYKGVMAPDLQRLRDPLQIRATDNDAERPNNEVIYDIMRSSYSDFFFIDRTSGRLDVNQNFLPRASPLLSDGKSRPKRSLTNNDTVISLIVRASDLGNPPLSDYVDVKIFKQEYGERVIRFIYPKESSHVRAHSRELESTLNALTGGNTEIMSIQPLRKGYLNSEIDPLKSDVTALVRFGLNTVIDVEKLMTKLNNSEVQKLQVETQEKEIVITALEDENNSYAIGVGFLVTFLIIIIIMILLCFFCEGCPLYRNSKSMAGDDGTEGVSYLRVEETARYRGVGDDISGTPGWWQCLPVFMRDIFLFCGYIPPNKKGSRVAWSADERERQRYGKITQPPEPAGVQDRVGMVQAIQRQQQQIPQQPLQLEDVEGVRAGPNQILGPQGIRMESRNSQFSQEPRRVFVLKDAMGIPRAGEGFREGNTYLLEDIEGRPREPALVPQNDPFQPGNAQLLRLHASPHDAAFFNESQRRGRRADVRPEEAGLFPNDMGMVQFGDQLVNQNAIYNNGQYVYEGQGYDPNNPNIYYQNGEYYQGSNGKILQDQRTQRDFDEYIDPDSERSNRDRSRVKKNAQSNAQLTDRSSEYDANARSLKSANIPGSQGYQHTKTSILRYESNKEKLEERREELLRQGKDPDEYCITHQGGGFGIYNDGKKGSTKDRERTIIKSDSKRNQNQFSMPSETKAILERQPTIPEIETNIEKEAAKRIQTRKNSSGQQAEEANTNQTIPNQSKPSVDYQNDGDKNEEIEKRRQQRRTEASEALSEKLNTSHGAQDIIFAPKSITNAQSQITHENAVLNNDSKSSNDVSNVSDNNLINLDSKESIEKAIASALVTMANNNGNGDAVKATIGSIENDNKNSDLNILSTQNNNYNDTQSSNNSQPGVSAININALTNNQENNINSTDLAGKSLKDKSVISDLNIKNESHSSLKVNQQETSEGTSQKDSVGVNNESSNTDIIFVKNNRNDSSILNIPPDKRKRNKLMEKKSVFTRAYDGMKTDQLRPESASGDP